ncbi:MAG: hypothetical protein ACI4R8_03420 [Candidatus Caccovivens sp.]
MSKTLSKILVVCAMIAIIPLMIVGTAFAAYYSISAQVNVYVYVNGDSVAEDAFAQVSYNDKIYNAKENFEIQEGHLNKVELTANAKGYDFKGWYVGNLESYANALKTDEVKFDAGSDKKISFNMTDYQNLVAVFEIRTIDVTWKYVANPNDLNTLTLTSPEGSTSTFGYGDALPKLTYSGDEWTFLGWNVNNGETIYTSANAEIFENESVELSAVWKETEKIDIKYYDGNTVLKEEKVYENTVNVLTDALSLAPTIENGYRYYWADAQGFEVSQINSNKSVDVYLKKELITYTVSLSTIDSDVTFVSTDTLTFNVNDNAKLENIFNVDNYKAKYSFWDVEVAIKYNDTTYSNMDDLADAIITVSPNAYVQANIVADTTVSKNFTNISVTNGITFTAGEGIISNKEVYDSTTGNIAHEITIIETQDTTSSVYSLLAMEQDGQIIPLYSDVNDDGTREEVVLKYLTVKIGANAYTVEVDGELSINDMIESLVKKASLTETATLTIDSIIARYVVA